ncbi:glutamate--cysteine ligase [Nitrosospira sp. NRS527]|uniref:glutamate--cysteine ligase n=1 Tax=Nitrosospira sp. NRS527 TaxID=155925 RepID=UPI001AFB6D58|nr:glutamate--cysteine ligase [Nitrosospira sp. NRS527]BCT68342.1 Glutamate--cysteine ligase [Nitrosospira sp. NRS527]
MSNQLSRSQRQTPIHESLQPLLIHGLKGIEKESLRINREGSISQSPHPIELGAALTHPHITTDYSEALLELITPALPDGKETLDFLTDLHKYVCTNINDELLLATSMPVGTLQDSAIPIARYSSSNVGMMKHIYRRGLGYRYGRCMQVIAGIHFNYSLPEKFWPEYQQFKKHKGDLQSFVTNAYMEMIRNLQRYGWLILYLFGSSPAVSKSFADSRHSAFSHTLEKFDETSYYKPFATSLRMSEIGYVNPVQAMFHISFNSLDEYIRDLANATTISYLDYEKIGVKTGGQYRQLNTNFLQIENEYYTSVRPKQPTRPNERPLKALGSRGIEYIEMRSIDIDIFEPAGISIETTRFLEALSLHCLFRGNSGHGLKQHEEVNNNALSVANQGRDPALKLSDNGRAVSLQNWALSLCEEMQEVCEVLDKGNDHKPYTQALRKQIEVVRHSELTSSARMLSAMRDQKLSITELVLQKSDEYTRYFQNATLDASIKKSFDFQVEASLEQQKRLDTMSEIPFERYLNNYFSGDTTANETGLQDSKKISDSGLEQLPDELRVGQKSEAKTETAQRAG